MSDSLQHHGLQLARLLCPWNSPGKNTRVGCHALLHRNFPTQGSNPSLMHFRQVLYHLSHQGEKMRNCVKGGTSETWILFPSLQLPPPHLAWSRWLLRASCHDGRGEGSLDTEGGVRKPLPLGPLIHPLNPAFSSQETVGDSPAVFIYEL